MSLTSIVNDVGAVSPIRAPARTSFFLSLSLTLGMCREEKEKREQVLECCVKHPIQALVSAQEENCERQNASISDYLS